MAVEGQPLEGGFGPAGRADVGEARDAVDDGGAAVEVGGFVRVAVGEGFGGGFGESVGDGEERVGVGVGEGVVDVFLGGGCGLGLEWEVDWYKVGGGGELTAISFSKIGSKSSMEPSWNG